MCEFIVMEEQMDIYEALKAEILMDRGEIKKVCSRRVYGSGPFHWPVLVGGEYEGALVDKYFLNDDVFNFCYFPKNKVLVVDSKFFDAWPTLKRMYRDAWRSR